MNKIIERYSNNPLTSLDGAINSSVTTITVESLITFPTLPQFRLLINSELLLVMGINVSAKQFTVERGIEGTVANSHPDNVIIYGILTVGAWTNIIAGPNQFEINNPIKGNELFLMACHQSIDELTYLMASVNGIDFNLISPDPILIPGSGNQRDPSILKINNLYWLIHTNSTNNYFTLLSSPNLKDWTVVTNISMASIATVHRVWAPQWFIDENDTSLNGIHIFVSCSTGGLLTNFQIYEVHPTNDSFSSWSTPVIITGTSLPSNMIDAFVVQKDGNYHLWYKEETAHYIEYLTSTSLLSGYTVTESGNWAGFGTLREAPNLIKIDNSTWRIYINEYSGIDSVAIYYSESVDDWATWSTPIIINSPWIPAHPDIIRVTDFPSLRNILGLSISTKIKGSQIRRVASQTISNTTTTALSFDTEDRDELNGWSISPNPTRFTIPSTGWYDLAAHIKWADVTGGKRVFDIRINSIVFPMSISAEASANHNGPDLALPLTYYFQKGDYIELTVWQNSGGNVNITFTRFYISRK